MDLSWGDGNFDVLLDVNPQTGVYLFPYGGPGAAQTVHERFGGRNYYTSRSGCSGAGWVPDRPGLFRVAVYRTDFIGDHIWLAQPNVLGRWTVTVPINYRGNHIDISSRSPIIVRDWEKKALFLTCSEDALQSIFLETMSTLSHSETISGWVHRPGCEDFEDFVCTTRTIVWSQPSDGRRPGKSFLRRLAANSSIEEFPKFPDGEDLEFWRPLGLRRVGEYAYVLRQGVAIDRLPVSEWHSAPLPGHILPLPAPSGEIGGDVPPAYVNIEDREALLLCPQELVWSRWASDHLIARDLQPGQVMALLVGDADARAQVWAQFAAAWPELVTRMGLKAPSDYCIHLDEADIPVSRQDAINAGFCKSGVDRFCNRRGWGDSVPLGELDKFAAIPEVSRVIRWKLCQIRGEEEE